MTELEIAEKLERNRREREEAKPRLSWCWCCNRHTGTRKCRYRPDECARCGAPRREP